MQTPNPPGRPRNLPPDHLAVDAADDNQPGRSGETVTVASKLPFPVKIMLYRMQTYMQNTPMGPREAQKGVAVDMPPYIINGCALPRGPDADNRDYPVVGGYALTSGIPREVWEQWRDQQAGNEYITKKLIFAATTEDRARGQAREYAKNRSGMEPVDPASPGKAVPGIEAGTRAA